MNGSGTQATRLFAGALPLLPAVLLGGFSLWSGTFPFGATATAGTAGYLGLLVFVAAAGRGWLDPLRLGLHLGSFLPLALWVAVGGSLLASPVPRAGRLGFVLLPAFLLLPTAVERCWQGEGHRRLGLRGLTLVTLAVATWSLLDWGLLGAPRAAMPLGHHNLLATWLVTLLPLALVPARAPGPWRWLALITGAGVLAALVAGRSLVGALVLGGQTAVVALGMARKRTRLRLPIGAGVALLALFFIAVWGGRLAEVLRGVDPSAQARWVYVQAGWQGFLKRPFLGAGPGATAWILAEDLDPVPGVNPPGEVVSDLHFLPLQLAYELGGIGLLLALLLVVSFLLRRLRDGPTARDPVLLAAALLGFVGGVVSLQGGGFLSVTAVPVALGISAGAALAALPGRPGVRGSRIPLYAYAVLVVLIWLPAGRAQKAYDDATASLEAGDALDALSRAQSLDPDFPLYRARRAWLESEETGDATAAHLALRAAQDARGLAPLWLAAGLLGYDSDAPWTRQALLNACDLDPLGALAPFYLLALDPDSSQAKVYGARALLAEPRLAAALFWQGRPSLLDETLQGVADWPGLDPGWRRHFRHQTVQLPPARDPDDWIEMALELDPEPSLSFSLFAFRRSRWPARLGQVEISRDRANRITVPAATRLRTTDPRAFRGRGCGDAELAYPAPSP